MQIEHDPKEPPRYKGGNGIFWALGVVIAALWTAFVAFQMLDWHSAALGFGTGAVFVIIMVEITGNRVPPWMRR